MTDEEKLLARIEDFEFWLKAFKTYPDINKIRQRIIVLSEQNRIDKSILDLVNILYKNINEEKISKQDIPENKWITVHFPRD